MTEQNKILGFKGEHAFLSNFWYVDVKFDGDVYRTTEHAYQAAKTDDVALRRMIRQLATPREAKAAGAKVTLTSDWDTRKMLVMLDVNVSKFLFNPELRQKLLETGDAYIEETNLWGDTFWGVCNGVGENNLGQILMLIRDQL